MKPAILVVDDEAAFLDSISYSLQTQGYTDITTVSDRSAAQDTVLLGIVLNI